MKKYIAYASIVSASLLTADHAFAQVACNTRTGIRQYNFRCVVGFAADAINQIVLILIGIGMVVFIWGLVKYISAAGDEAKIKEAKQFIVFGLIAFFVIMSMWGLVNILLSIFPGGALLIPQLK